MKEFQSVKSIFNNLKDFEVRELRKKLLGKSNANDSQKISLKYLDFLANSVDISLMDVQLKLYNKLNLSAFRKLNQRLFDKMLDVVSNNELIELNDSYDDRAKIIFALERKLLLVDLFRFRGLFKLSDEILNQVISSSKEYECFEILIYALYKKRIRFPGTDSNEEIKLLDKDLSKYQKFSLSLSYIKKIYTDLILLHSRCEVGKTISEYRLAMKKVDSLELKINSYTLRFYSSMIKAQYFSMNGNNSKAGQILIELLDSVNGTLLFSNNRYGTIMLNIALYKRNAHEFNQANLYLNEASKYLNRIKETKVVLYYQNAVLNFISGDLNKSNYYGKLISNLEIEKIDVSLKNRIYFLFILNLFVAGKYQEALLHLSTFKIKNRADLSLEIEKKILQLMTTIELAKYDHADKIFDLLRKSKFVFTSSDFRLFSNKKIIFLLSCLKNVGYDFSSLSKKDLDSFNSFLKEDIMKDDFLIPFTAWFKSKLKNVPYDHSAAMKEMRKKYKAEQIELA